MQTTIIVITLILATISFAPFLPSKHWIVKIWEFPRLQICVLIAANLLFAALALPFGQPSSNVILLGNVLLLSYQLIWIFPYTKLSSVQVKRARYAPPERTICLLSANVLMRNQNTQGLVDIVLKHQPDVLVTLETNRWWQDELGVLHEQYPHRVAQPLENLYGMHLYSKLPLSDVKVLNIIEQDVPSIHCLVELPCGEKVRCHFLHPAPPSPTENEESTERDRELVHVAKKVLNNEAPVIVSGDLNDVAWSPTTKAFREISGLLDPRVGRGMYNTFHASYPFARWSLDHVFHSSEFEVLELERLPGFGSDHYPLLTRLVLT